MPTARVNGIEMYYEEIGGGEPLILIMGFGGDHLAWAFQARAFAERYRVVTFDNRGVGQSDAPDTPYSIRTMADDTAALMTALGIDRAHVVAASMGGMIGQELALGYPARVRTLHLACTTARPDAHMKALLATWRELRTTLSRPSLVRAMALWLFSFRTYAARPEFVEMVIQTALATPYPQSLAGFLGQAAAIEHHDTLARLQRLHCPTLVTVGEDDVLVPPRFSHELAARIPGATLRTVPEAGHVYFWEQPEAFNRLCLDFLAGVRREGAATSRG